MFYDAQTIEQINNSINVVDYAAQYLNLKESNGEYWSICPFHPNDCDPSLSLNREKNMFFCFGCATSGDLIQFVMEYHKISFPQAIDKLIKYANLTLIPKEKSELIDFLQKISKKNKEVKSIKHPILPSNIMEKYLKKPIKEWLEEGIKQELLDLYNVRYDTFSNRIVFPVRDIDGNIIAIKGRTLYKNYKELGLPKYIYYQEIGTNDFLFGLYKNINEIKRKKEVIVFEGMKAVLLAEGYGYKNVVSLETNRISEEQIKLLLSMKVDVVLALDKGMKIVTKKLKNTNSNVNINIGTLPKLTNVYIVDDKLNLLPDKASPVDCGKEIWDALYERRYKI